MRRWTLVSTGNTAHSSVLDVGRSSSANSPSVVSLIISTRHSDQWMWPDSVTSATARNPLTDTEPEFITDSHRLLALVDIVVVDRRRAGGRAEERDEHVDERDLPAPFGPSNPNSSPSLTVKESPSAAARSPNVFVNSVTRIAVILISLFY